MIKQHLIKHMTRFFIFLQQGNILYFKLKIKDHNDKMYIMVI